MIKSVVPSVLRKNNEVLQNTNDLPLVIESRKAHANTHAAKAHQHRDSLFVSVRNWWQEIRREKELGEGSIWASQTRW
jgi:hypothetical protein